MLGDARDDNLSNEGSDNESYDAPQGGAYDVHYRPSPRGAIDRLDVELGSHIQEKMEAHFERIPAGFTCDECPQPSVWKHIRTGRRIWCNQTVVEHEDWAYLWVDPPKPVERCKTCNRRRERHKRVQRNLRFVAETEGLDSLRFITLTKRTRERSEDYNELEDLAWMKHEMSKFRRTKEFNEHIQGAHVFFEVKEGAEGRLHTHIHMAASGKFWDQRELETAWGGIVDIRKVRSLSKLTGYLAGYLSKSEPYESQRCRETIGNHRGIPKRRKEYFTTIKASIDEAYRIKGYFARWDFWIWLAGNPDYQYFWMKMLSR